MITACSLLECHSDTSISIINLHFLFKSKKKFVYWKGSVGREEWHPLSAGSLPPYWGLGLTKIWNQELSLGLPYGWQGPEALKSFSIAFPGFKQEGAGLEMERLELKLLPVWNTLIVGGSFTYYTTLLAVPVFILWKSKLYSTQVIFP